MNSLYYYVRIVNLCNLFTSPKCKYFFLKVLKKRKEEILKRKRSILEMSNLSSSLNRGDGNVSKIELQESEKIDDELSFGQSAGLKDDLDLDNNVGK